MLRHFSLHRGFQQGNRADTLAALKKNAPIGWLIGANGAEQKGTHEACSTTENLNQQRRTNVIVLSLRHNASEFKIKSLIFAFHPLH